ncbi:MAG: HAD-IIA family hydrolase [Candidatus Lokiarchaeota archaeon]|nr:HAD-IIA family hydrolase [Candidatus Lokiarchaeota archaeon]
MPMSLKDIYMEKDIFILDLDGTVYRGKSIITDADNAIKKLLNMGKKVIYLTNNATKTPQSFCTKLNNMNIPCNLSQIVSSGYITSKMLAEEYNVKSAYILGTKELVHTIESQGITTLNNTLNEKKLLADFLDSSITCDAVVCAMDLSLTYAKIRTAMELINRGASFYATNGDKTFPESQQIWPGAGMTIAAVEACVGRPPEIVFGKPNTYGIDLIFQELNKNNKTYKRSDAILIGDRLETDIWQANNAAIDSILVETGIDTRNTIPKKPYKDNENYLVPTYVEAHIKNLFNA